MAHKGKKQVTPKHNWNSLKALNRIPEVHLERRIAEINRYKAFSMHELHLQEKRLWDEMFDNEKVLKTSLARFPRQEVIDRLVLVEKDKDDEDKPLPFAEYYRQFIIFKARRMAKIFGNSGARQPRYSDLYRKELAPARNNKRNVKQLLKKYQEVMLADQKKLDILNDDQLQIQQPEEDDTRGHFPFNQSEATVQFTNRKFGSKLQHARRQHRRGGGRWRRESGDFGDAIVPDPPDHDPEIVSHSRVDQSQTSLAAAPETVEAKELNGIANEQEKPLLEPDRSTAYKSTAFNLPKISDRYRNRSDRKIHVDYDAADEGHVSPLPEVIRKTPILDIYKRRRSRQNSSSSSDDDD